MVEQVQVGERPHPRATTYVGVATILAIVTAFEVAAYYIEALRGVIVPTLLGLSATKFALVVLFYMHLKFDSRIFSGIFVFGLTVALALLLALMALFHALF